MAIVTFELPDELKTGVSANEIVQAMLAQIDGVDKTEGGFVYDMVKPTALEKAELLQFWLPLALMTMSHIWATGRWLDYHAHDIGMARRPATYAYGNLEITTTGKVSFPTGFIFCVPSVNSSPAIDFELVEGVTTSGAETITVRIKAVESGTYSNVEADTISIMKTPLKGVEKITNPEPLMGGTEAESDDSLRQRIDDFYAGRMASFVGNKKDYERWAKEIPGVGYAHCIPLYFKMWQTVFKVVDAEGNDVKGNLQVVAGDKPNELKIVDTSSTEANPHTLSCEMEYTGKNSVKIVLCDSNGEPANSEICAAVEKHIFGTGHDDLERLAPIGVAKWEVAPPDLVVIDIKLNAKIDEEYPKEVVEENIRTDLQNYFKTLADEDNYFGTLRFMKVSAVLSNVTGLIDFKHLRINDSMNNVEFSHEEMPKVGTITLLDFD